MNSLLKFSWRRDKANAENLEEHHRSSRYESISSLPPVVTASNSCDTISDEAENFKITIARLPTTPEGLRPRRANCFIQRDLGLSSHHSESQRLPPTVSQLPPRLTTSWSTQGIISSGSSGGPCSHAHSGSHGVAQSPHLLPGQARTAVGALVAMNIGPEQNQQSQERYRWTPDWGLQGHQSFNDEESPDPAKENEYFALDDNTQNDMRIPVPDPNTNRSFVDSPISKASSLAGSPSSRANMFFHRGERSKLGENNNINTSFSSQTRLIHATNTSFASRAMQMNSETMGAYDFTPLVDGQEVILSSLDHLTNMSAMSQSALDQESSHILEPDSNHFYLMNEDYVPSPQYAHLDYALRKSKSENQRHAKEELIVATVGRLQDNVSFISKIQTFGGLQAGMDDWSTPERLGNEGLLTGFSQDKRAAISLILGQIMDEMENSTSDEYEINCDLRDSLRFCRKLVMTAVSQSEGHQRGQWRIHDHVKSCLGILVHPETPEVARGGDTSVFSLPSGCDETPMTSNVSLTTTITSAMTTPNGRKTGKTMKPFVDGLVLRRTIDIFCTLLEKWTQSCHALLNLSAKWHAGSEASIRVTEEIKRTYLQLLAMETHDLHSLVDSFVYHAVPLGITHEDEVQDDDRLKGNFVLPPPPALLSDPFLQPLILASSSSSEEVEDIPPPFCAERDMFSPSTEDMRTLHPNDDDEYVTDDEDGYDDLRRQVGSGDHDDDDESLETREGPPSSSMMTPGTPIIHPSLLKMGLTSPMSI